jgi:O-antigen/teichoic acid export membrane protein
MFKSILQSISTRGGIAIFNFLVLILSSRYLGVSTRGEISIMILNLAAVQIINEIITGYSLVSFIPKANLKRLYIWGAGITCINALVSTFFLWSIGKTTKGTEWLIVPLSFLVISNTFNLVILLGKQDLKQYNRLSILQPFLLLVGLFFTTRILGIYTFEGYVYPLFASFFFTFILTSYYAFGYVRQQTQGEFPLRRILLLGFFAQAATLMHILSNRYSYYLLESNAQIGLYSSACSLIESVWVVMAGINPIVLARVANKGDTHESRVFTLTMARLSFVLSAAACLAVFIIPSELFTLLLGKSFNGVKHIMLLYIPGILMISFSGILAHYFSALGQLKRTLMCNSIGFVFTVIAAPFLIKKWGIEGALLAANISYFFSSLALFISFAMFVKLPFHQLFDFKNDWKRITELLKK